MSVTVTAVIVHRPYPRPPGAVWLPEAIWYTQAAIAGDVSGGHMEVSLILNASGDTRSGRSWSIEVSCPRVSGGATDDIARFVCNNLDNIGPGLTNPLNKAFAQRLLFADSTVDAPSVAVVAADMHPSLFLGSQGASSNDAEINMQMDNNDGTIFAWYAAGYVWGPEALRWGRMLPSHAFTG